MTNAELIQKIRAEIERRIKLYSVTNEKEQWIVNTYWSVLSFLSTLEESEKPMNLEDTDTEIGHWMEHLDDKYCLLVPHYSIQDLKDTARHFAQWGAEHTPLPEDTVIYQKGVEEGKRLMMEEAVEAIISQCPGSNEIIFHNPITIHSWEFPWKFSAKGLNKGDKVKLIIVKEDGK